VAELFQWKEHVKEGLEGWSSDEREHVAQELSDVLIYLLRLADRCHVNLPLAALKKMQMNSKKYPVEAVKGSIKKFAELHSSNQ